MNAALDSKPKQRIFKAAVFLFARNGYASVGIRMTAKRARVNGAMISYYFGGKAGLLKTIIDSFFGLFQPIMLRYSESPLPLDEWICAFVHDTVAVMRDNSDLCTLGVMELPFDKPKIAEYKAEKIRTMQSLFTHAFLGTHTLDEKHDRNPEIASPAIFAMLFSTCLLRPIIHETTGVIKDRSFSEQYENTIGALLLKGLSGIVEEGARS